MKSFLILFSKRDVQLVSVSYCNICIKKGRQVFYIIFIQLLGRNRYLTRAIINVLLNIYIYLIINILHKYKCYIYYMYYNTLKHLF